MATGSGTGTVAAASTSDAVDVAILAEVAAMLDIDTTQAEVDAHVDELIAGAKDYITAYLNLDRFPYILQGRSVSNSSASTSLIALSNNTIALSVDGSGYEEIELTLASCTTGALTAAELQTQIRAAKSSTEAHYWNWAYVTATFASGVYTVTSPTFGPSSNVHFISSQSTEQDVIGALKLSPTYGGVEQSGQARNQQLERAAALIAINAWRAMKLRPESFERGAAFAVRLNEGGMILTEQVMGILRNNRWLTV